MTAAGNVLDHRLLRSAKRVVAEDALERPACGPVLLDGHRAQCPPPADAPPRAFGGGWSSRSM